MNPFRWRRTRWCTASRRRWTPSGRRSGPPPSRTRTPSASTTGSSWTTWRACRTSPDISRDGKRLVFIFESASSLMIHFLHTLLVSNNWKHMIPTHPYFSIEKKYIWQIFSNRKNTLIRKRNVIPNFFLQVFQVRYININGKYYLKQHFDGLSRRSCRSMLRKAILVGRL